MPKVSICIPVYKDINGVKRLLKSISEQSFTDYEIIITDDSPNEDAKTVFEEFSLQIIYVHNDKPLGACGNWNKSIDLATGEYIKIVHQDDFFTSQDSLANFVRMLDENPQADFAFSGSRQVTICKDNPFDTSNYYDRCISDENLENMTKDYRDLYNGDWVGAPSATIFRRCDVRFDDSLTWIIDVDFYMSMLKRNSNFVCTKEPLISIGVSDTQLTNKCIEDGELNIFEYRHVMQKFDLQNEAVYRKRLCYIAVYYKKKYNAISDLGIPKQEYKKELNARRKYLFLFYCDLIKRKLFRQ